MTTRAIRDICRAISARTSRRSQLDGQGAFDLRPVQPKKPRFSSTFDTPWRHLAIGANLCLLLSCSAVANLVFATAADSRHNKDQDADVYRANWADGVDPRIGRQEVDRNAITVVWAPEFQGPALRISITRSDDYSGVANGSPRAELAFEHLTRFAIGGDYEIRWSTMIPQDYDFDRQQPEIITQIHQSSSPGSPPFALILAGDRYRIDIRGLHDAKNIVFGDASHDRGRRIFWLLKYRPDDTGQTAATDLYKDGVLIARGGPMENAYPNDRNAYLKIGLYKWNWNYRPSDVAIRTMYYGDVEVRSFKPSRRSNDE